MTKIREKSKDGQTIPSHRSEPKSQDHRRESLGKTNEEEMKQTNLRQI